MSAGPRARRLSSSLLALFLILGGVGEAGAWRPGARLSFGGRTSLRETKAGIRDELVGRGELELLPEEKQWHLFPYLEGRRDLEGSVWSRLDAGVGGAWEPCRWFSLSTGFQQSMLDPGDDHPEWEIQPTFSVPLPWSVRDRKLSLYALNEYAFNLGEGEGERNEVAAGIRIPLPTSQRLTVSLGWRHTDLIHTADLDQFEGHLIAEF